MQVLLGWKQKQTREIHKYKNPFSHTSLSEHGSYIYRLLLNKYNIHELNNEKGDIFNKANDICQEDFQFHEEVIKFLFIFVLGFVHIGN